MQGIGAILNVKWVAEGQVYCSDACTAQGIIQVIGEAGVAMATLAIAIHTFLVIFFRWSPSPRAAWIWKVAICFIWLYVVLYSLIGFATHHVDPIDAFYTPTPYWCWISNDFNPERVTAEYLWLWIAAFTSIILYTFLFFRVRGNITVDPLDWRRVRFKWRRWNTGNGDGDGYFDGSGRGARGGEAGRRAAREALSMIWYPVTYTALVLPLSIVRWSTFRPIGQAEPNVPFALTCVVVTIFSLSGIVNVSLILLTRKNLLLFGQRGVVNPARIGPAATRRLPPPNDHNTGGAGVVDGVEKRGRFHLRGVGFGIRAHKHAEGSKRETTEESTGQTSDNYRRTHEQGETSFLADRFTTQAYFTERSFDVGSNRAPFSPVIGPTDTDNTKSTPTGIVTDEKRSDNYGYGYGQELGEGGGIPEGMSGNFGTGSEYDMDRNREPRSRGVEQQSSTTADGNPSVGMLDVAIGRGGQTTSNRQETQAANAGGSNLEMKDPRPNLGLLEPLDPPQYPPPSHPPPNLHSHSPSQTQSPLPPLQQQLYADSRRGSAGTGKNVGGSRPNSAKSRAGSSVHQRPSAEMTDYSIPMKVR